MSTTCSVCSVTKAQRAGQWWYLSGYYGLSGGFCPDCFDKASHDPYGSPKCPAEYTKILSQYNHRRNSKMQ